VGRRGVGEDTVQQEVDEVLRRGGGAERVDRVDAGQHERAHDPHDVGDGAPQPVGLRSQQRGDDRLGAGDDGWVDEVVRIAETLVVTGPWKATNTDTIRRATVREIRTAAASRASSGQSGLMASSSSRWSVRAKTLLAAARTRSSLLSKTRKMVPSATPAAAARSFVVTSKPRSRTSGTAASTSDARRASGANAGARVGFGRVFTTAEL
jgi:hypothetical protein